MKKTLFKFLSQLFIITPLMASAAAVNLAEKPLVETGSAQVLPNIMYILDNSGSMVWDFAPDYISHQGNGQATFENTICRDSGDDNGTVTANGASLDVCHIGTPPYMSPDINKQYYNPETYYKPPVNANNTSSPRQSNPTNVSTDGVGIGAGVMPYTQEHSPWRSGFGNNNVASINLTTQYPDVLWCDRRNPTAADLLDPTRCRANTGYTYPDATFRFARRTGNVNVLSPIDTPSIQDLNIVRGAPYYYRVVPTEYCAGADLRSCRLQNAPDANFPFPARDRWCKDNALTNCQASRSSDDPLTPNVPNDGYMFPRYVGFNNNGVEATGRFSVTQANAGVRVINRISVAGVDITCGGFSSSNLSAAANAATRNATLAQEIANRINSCTSAPDFQATRSGAQVTVTALMPGPAGNGVFTHLVGAGTVLGNFVNMAGGAASTGTPDYVFQRVNIEPGTATNPTTFPRYPGRSDCGPTACTYAQEIENFGNWYAYYRTRMQSMKSSTSLAFAAIDDKYRVGFVTINRSQYLPINQFVRNTGNNQKNNWYTQLFTSNPRDGSGTPLRSALSWVGRNFAGQVGTDPMQYACQANYAMLTTDGYWNSDTNATVVGLTNGPALGNEDGGTTSRPKFEGPTASSRTLADVAKYYFDQDLRTAALGNCNGVGANRVCGDEATDSPDDKVQNMTTFTLGLGVDGALLYDPRYKDFVGDFAFINSGAAAWPVPADGSPNNIDDLWHAAVNGEGTYFSAKDPKQLRDSLTKALSEINVKIGAASAAAASSLQPTAGNNLNYVASYIPNRWTGNLEARTVDLLTLKTNRDAVWCVEDVAKEPCAAGELVGSPNATSGSSSNVAYCRSTVADQADCDALGGTLGSVLGGSGTASQCYVEAADACVGKLKNQVQSTTTTGRKIYFNANNSLQNFAYANLPATLKDYFTTEFDRIVALNNPTVSPSVTATTDTTRATKLVEYLRGARGYEDSASNDTADNRLFRRREAILGDITQSQPAFFKKPIFNYGDTGYQQFKANGASRSAKIYVGANDGMLHVFDASDTSSGGTESWAFIPTPVLRNMTKLAETSYGGNTHRNFVNGDPFISDVCSNPCTGASSWKTILVGGLAAGGRGYYAIDITDPDNPSLLWEFTAENNANLGFSYGKPIITKKNDGTWVVVVASGYNNGRYAKATDTVDQANPGNGSGYVFVLNALTGNVISSYSTGVGDNTNPSGLARITDYSASPFTNNNAKYIYGGDLKGNMFRFDINATSGNVLTVAQLGATRPITVAPEVGVVDKKTVVFFGTGKYLEQSDLTTTNVQGIYAIKDDGTTLTNVSNLVQHTLSSSGQNRTVTLNANKVSFKTGRGWYVDLPPGERVNLNPLLLNGVLLVPSIVPTSTTCDGGGYGWFNYFDYATGGSPIPGNNLVGERLNSPAVGFNVTYGSDGKPVVSVVESDDPTGRQLKNKDIAAGGGANRTTIFFKNPDGSYGTRSIWRELTE